MKKSIWILLISLFCFEGNAQKKESPEKNIQNESKIKKITFDLNSDTLSYRSLIMDKEEFIEVEIKNVNLFLYSIKLSEIQNDVINDSRLNENNTSLIINPVNYDISDVAIRNIIIPPITSNIMDRDKKIKFEKTNYEIIRNSDKINVSISGIAKILRLRNDYFTLSNDSNESDSKKNEIKQSLNLLDINGVNDDDIKLSSEAKIVYHQNKIKQARESIKQQEAELLEIDKKSGLEAIKIADLTNNLHLYRKEITKLTATVHFYKALLCLLYSEKPFKELQKDRETLAGNYFTKTDQVGILQEMNKILMDLDEYYTKMLISYSELDSTTKKENKENINALTVFHKQIKVTAFENFFLQIAKVYGAINEKNFSLKYRTLIINPDADEILFKLDFVPQNNLPCVLSNKPYSLSYKLKIKTGWKLDVSTGLFANIGAVRNRSYYFATEGNKRMVKEESRDVATPSIGVLLNIYKRNFPIGVSTGISTSDAQRLKYYLGGSYLLGGTQRIVLSAGAVLGQVDVPTSEFAVDKPIDAGVGTLPSSVPLRSPSPYRLGFYFGITYNLTGKNKSDYLTRVLK